MNLEIPSDKTKKKKKTKKTVLIFVTTISAKSIFWMTSVNTSLTYKYLLQEL